MRWHVDQMRARGLRDVRFITPTAMSYGSQTDEPGLAAVEELLAGGKEGIGPDGRVFFGSFPSEIRPEHVSREALKLVRRHGANTSIRSGAGGGQARPRCRGGQAGGAAGRRGGLPDQRGHDLRDAGGGAAGRGRVARARR